MVKNIFFYDKKAESFLSPFCVPNRGVVYRMLGDEIRRGGEGNLFASHPEDFCCYYIGQFDEETAYIAPVKSPELIFELADLKGV